MLKTYLQYKIRRVILGFILAKLPFILGFLLLIAVTTMYIGAVQQYMMQSAPEGNLICRQTGQELTEEELKPFMKNAFKGYESVLLESSKKHGVNPVLVYAIMMHETGYGTSKMVKERNNPAGLMGSGSPFVFSSLAEGIDAAVANLYKLYISQGLVTIPDIQKKYAPIGAGNDPTGLNNNWINNVTSIANKLGGYNATCDETGGIFDGDISELGFQYPVKSPLITSDFGMRIHPITGVPKLHNGTDFGHPIGTPVYSVLPGIVEYANMAEAGSSFNGYGNVILINHENGFYSLYAHLSIINVTEGMSVQRGQLIGKVGTTGNSTGAHLHFEIRTNPSGGQVDPMIYLPKIN